MMGDNNKIDILASVFGCNPFNDTETQKRNIETLPKWATANYEILSLIDLYQQQLAELSTQHTILLNDQEKFDKLIKPHIDPHTGVFQEPFDDNLLLIKRGLDLRLQEFEEDCRRIQQTERRLQRKIDTCTLSYESSLIEAQGYAEQRLIEQINQQQRIIEYQQHELDELRFQRDLYSDETLRLRQICRFGEFPKPSISNKNKDEYCDMSPRTLHETYSANKPPFGWMRKIRHNNKETIDLRSINLDKINRISVENLPQDMPFIVHKETLLDYDTSQEKNSRNIFKKKIESPKVDSISKAVIKSNETLLSEDYQGSLDSDVSQKKKIVKSSSHNNTNNPDLYDENKNPIIYKKPTSYSHTKLQLEANLPQLSRRYSGLGLSIGTRQNSFSYQSSVSSNNVKNNNLRRSSFSSQGRTLLSPRLIRNNSSMSMNSRSPIDFI